MSETLDPYSIVPDYKSEPSELIGTSIDMGSRRQNVVVGGLNQEALEVVSLKNQAIIGNTPQPVISMYSLGLPESLGGSLQPEPWLAKDWWGEELPYLLLTAMVDYLDETKLGNAIVRSDQREDLVLHGELAIEYMRNKPHAGSSSAQLAGCVALTDIPEVSGKDSVLLMDYELMKEFEADKTISIEEGLLPECINPGVQIGLTRDFIFAVSITAMQDIAVTEGHAATSYIRNRFSPEYIKFIDIFARNICGNHGQGSGITDPRNFETALRISAPVFLSQALDAINSNSLSGQPRLN